jgi:DNA replication factor GINS
MSPPAEEFTFEDLTEVYRREQRNKTISEVRRDFYPAMRDCLDNLKRESEREFAVDQFSTKAKLASNQLMKFQEKSAQVFEFRFGKLMDLALRAAQGARLETTRLTIEEQEVYDKVYSMLKDCRAVILEGIRPRAVEMEEPSLTTIAAPEMVVEAMREEQLAATTPVNVPQAVEEVVTAPSVPAEVPAEEPKVLESPMPKAVVESPAAAAPLSSPDHIVLRIIEDIPAFAGPGRTYRLQKEDLVSLPQAIAKAFIARKKAIAVQVR